MSRGDLKSLKYVYDLTDFVENLIWQNQMGMAKRPQNTGKNPATNLFYDNVF